MTGAARPIRVVIVDDQALMRTAFRIIFEEAGDIEVVGEAADGQSGVQVARRTAPDVVLMDVRMPGVDGIEGTRRILATIPNPPRVLILTTFDLDEYVYDALRAGASGFLLKDALAADLLTAVCTVASGAAVTAPSVTGRLIARFLNTTPATSEGAEPAGAQQDGADRLAALTEREREVLTLIAGGLSNAEIAAELHLSPSTVSTHIGRILAKLNLRDRVQAVILGYEHGLVPPHRP